MNPRAALRCGIYPRFRLVKRRSRFDKSGPAGAQGLRLSRWGEIIPLGGWGELPKDDTGVRLRMKATKAYIASLGTTGVLLAASILMLAIVSAVVAFDAWPGAGVPNRTPTLVLAARPASIAVSTHSAARSATPAARRVTAVPARPRVTVPLASQRVLAFHQTGGSRPASPAPATKPPAVIPAKPLESVQQAASPIIDAVSNPAGTASQLADAAQGTTNSTGVALGKVSPQVGGLVTQVGDLVAQTLRDLPLPQHLTP